MQLRETRGPQAAQASWGIDVFPWLRKDQVQESVPAFADRNKKTK